MEKELRVKISVDRNTGALQVVGTEFDILDNKIKKTTDSTSSYSKALIGIGAAAGGLYVVKQFFDTAYEGAKKFVKTADDMSMVNSRLSLVTKSTREYVNAQTELLSISNNARVGIKNSTDLYSQLARSTSSLGTSQKDLLQVTDTISKTLTISGASATSADAALVQLSQGFASGTLRGDELNSVMEQTPRLAQAIADGMGISIGQLRTMGQDGLLTSQAVMNALLTQSRTVNEEFSKIAVTASSGYTVLDNTIDNTVSKIDGQYKVTQNIGLLFIATGQTIDTIFTQLSSGWDNGGNSAIVFGNIMISTIKGFLSAMGYTYDALETMGAIFSTIRYAGETAFYAVESTAIGMAYSIRYVMEKTFNFIISGINEIIDSVNKMMSFVGGTQFEHVNTVNFTDTVGENLSNSQNKLIEASTNLKNSVVDIFNTGKGQEWADTIGATLDLKFKTLLADAKEANANANPSSNNSSVALNTDIFTNSLNTNNTANTTDQTATTTSVQDTSSYLDNITSSLSDTTSALDTFNTSLGEDGTYSVVNDTNSAVSDTSSSLSNLSNSLEDVTTSADKANDIFFAFSDTLLNSLTSNADSLLSVATTATTVVEMSYSTALSNMEAVKKQLIANPLNKDIGQKYADAFSQFQNSSSTFLNKDNFATKSGYDFATATVSTQMNQYQSTAIAGYSVLDSMNNFLESINSAFEDGILTDEEKRTISGVADTVNERNDILLGNGGAVVGAVNNQEYYNNTGLATDEKVNTLYKGQNIGTSVINQISGFATDGAIYNNANTVSSVVSSLRGGQNSGISLSGIIGTLPSLAVSTGLDVSQLSNLSAIKTATDSTKNATNYMTGNNSTSLKNLQVKWVSTKVTYEDYRDRYSSLGMNLGSSWAPSTLTNAMRTSETTNYSYYDKGGFTGLGYGVIDQTGFRQAGIVHEDEWVGPKWMIKENPAIFAQLEAIRKKGSFATGGYTSASSYSISNGSNKELEQNTRDIRELTKNHILLTRDVYVLLARLTNNGDAMLIEAKEAV